MSEVDFVDAEGQVLLGDMHREGVRLIAATPLIRALIAEIERAARCATVEEKPSRRSDVIVSSDPSARHPGAV
jgi:hypothetical protein